MPEYPDSEVIRSVFLRAGGEGEKTKFFENLSDSDKAILNIVKYEPGEVPVLAYINDKADWSLVTTRRVVWSDSTHIRSIAVSCLRKVEPQLASDYDLGRRRKSEFRELRLVTSDGEKINLSIEPGKPFIAFWNTIRWLAIWAERHS